MPPKYKIFHTLFKNSTSIYLPYFHRQNKWNSTIWWIPPLVVKQYIYPTSTSLKNCITIGNYYKVEWMSNENYLVWQPSVHLKTEPKLQALFCFLMTVTLIIFVIPLRIKSQYFNLVVLALKKCEFLIQKQHFYILHL